MDALDGWAADGVAGPRAGGGVACPSVQASSPSRPALPKMDHQAQRGARREREASGGVETAEFGALRRRSPITEFP